MIHSPVPWHIRSNQAASQPANQTFQHTNSIRFAIDSRNAIDFFFSLFFPFLLLLLRVCAWFPFYISLLIISFPSSCVWFIFFDIFFHIFPFCLRSSLYFDNNLFTMLQPNYTDIYTNQSTQPFNTHTFTEVLDLQRVAIFDFMIRPFCNVCHWDTVSQSVSDVAFVGMLTTTQQLECPNWKSPPLGNIEKMPSHRHPWRNSLESRTFRFSSSTFLLRLVLPLESMVRPTHNNFRSSRLHLQLQCRFAWHYTIPNCHYLRYYFTSTLLFRRAIFVCATVNVM